MAEYAHLIRQNIAPPGASKIGAFSESGTPVGVIPIGNLAFPNSSGQLLYRIGALADLHLGKTDDANEHEDLARALTYLTETAHCVAVFACGDLTEGGSDAQFLEYAKCVEQYASGVPVYPVAGNHDAWGGNIESRIQTYTGHPLYYSIEIGDDIYIMVGIKNDTDVFTEAELQWLYEALEVNRNRRCFVFQHALRFDGCGNPYPGVNPTYEMLNKANGEIFLSLVTHYPNVIWFHGHSHTEYGCQLANKMANYDHQFGIHSVHIPSISGPRSFDGSAYIPQYTKSEGYVVDVYANGIHLRGRDFVKGEFLPIASYWLDTTLQTVEAGTYTDPTGTIIT